MTDQPPRFAYENPADLGWGAQMINTWAKRRRARIAAEHRRDQDDVARDSQLHAPYGGGGGGDDDT